MNNYRRTYPVAWSVAVIGIPLAIALVALPAMAGVKEKPEICPAGSSGKIDAKGDPLSVTHPAPAGSLIVSYCVKAGQDTYFVTLPTSVATIVITPRNGKAVSHYSVNYVASSTPPVSSTPTSSVTPTPTVSVTPTPTVSVTVTQSPSVTPTATTTATATATAAATATATVGAAATVTPTETTSPAVVAATATTTPAATSPATVLGTNETNSQPAPVVLGTKATQPAVPAEVDADTDVDVAGSDDEAAPEVPTVVLGTKTVKEKVPSGQSMPFTGSNALALAGLGFALILLGATLVFFRRRGASVS